MEEFAVAPPKPKRVQQHVAVAMFSKEACPQCSGPSRGFKDPNQLIVKAECNGQVMQLNIVSASLDVYTFQALKSKVRGFLMTPFLFRHLVPTLAGYFLW